jgi:hypothetical protein
VSCCAKRLVVEAGGDIEYIADEMLGDAMGTGDTVYDGVGGGSEYDDDAAVECFEALVLVEELIVGDAFAESNEYDALGVAVADDVGV